MTREVRRGSTQRAHCVIEIAGSQFAVEVQIHESRRESGAVQRDRLCTGGRRFGGSESSRDPVVFEQQSARRLRGRFGIDQDRVV